MPRSSSFAARCGPTPRKYFTESLSMMAMVKERYASRALLYHQSGQLLAGRAMRAACARLAGTLNPKNLPLRRASRSARPTSPPAAVSRTRSPTHRGETETRAGAVRGFLARGARPWRDSVIEGGLFSPYAHGGEK